MVCLGRPYHFKFFKGCLPQILLGPFLNYLTYSTGRNWKAFYGLNEFNQDFLYLNISFLHPCEGSSTYL